MVGMGRRETVFQICGVVSAVNVVDILEIGQCACPCQSTQAFNRISKFPVGIGMMGRVISNGESVDVDRPPSSYRCRYSPFIKSVFGELTILGEFIGSGHFPRLLPRC